MHKRGQVSIFIIVGIVAIAAVILMFVLIRSFQEKARETTNPQVYLKIQADDIKKMGVKCIDDESREALRKLYWQGGHFNPIRYVNRFGNKTSVLCAKIVNDESCFNMMFTKENIADELKPVLERGIKSCINSGLNDFKNKDYIVNTGNFSLNFEFNDKVLLVTIDYPVNLSKGNSVMIQKEFVKEVRTNFWKAAELTRGILSKEAIGEEVDLAVLSPNNFWFSIGRTEFNDKTLYMLVSRYTSDPIFYFAVEK